MLDEILEMHQAWGGHTVSEILVWSAVLCGLGRCHSILVEHCKESQLVVTQPPDDLTGAEGHRARPQLSGCSLGSQLQGCPGGPAASHPGFPLFSPCLRNWAQEPLATVLNGPFLPGGQPDGGGGLWRRQGDSRCPMISVCFLLLEFFL